VRAVSAVCLLLPQIPMLFMGEEWDCQRPFPFFCDFSGDLAEAVVRGRRDEFSRFPEFADPEQRERIPDPVQPATFAAARLDWESLDAPAPSQALEWHRSILAARHREVIPRLSAILRAGIATVHHSGAIRIAWRAGDGTLLLCCNLQSKPAQAGPAPAGRVLWQEGSWDGPVMGPWCTHWSLEDNTP